MGIMQTQITRKDHHAFLPDNPFVPPEGDVCYINNLPPELLSRIFEVGAADNEDDAWHCPDDIRHYHPSEKDADDQDSHDNNVDMTEELEDQGRDGNGEGDRNKRDGEETDGEGDSDTTGTSDFSDSWPPFQIVVSHVCRHWRNVAFSTPSLWTTVVVSSDLRPPYQHVSTLLERSKGLLIDIYIDCELQEVDEQDESQEDEYDAEPDDGQPDDGLPDDADLEFLYSLLIPHVHRWRTIDVQVSEYHHMHAFLSAVSDPSIPAASQLTTLELYHHEEVEEFDAFQYPRISNHLTLFGGSAPCLTSLVLWGVHVDWDQPWIASAFNLKHLELAYHAEDVRPSWAQFSSILRGPSGLEKLNLRMSGPSGDPPVWFTRPNPGSPVDLNTPIQLLKVTDLTLAFHSPERAVGLLRKLHLPALKNLHLDFETGDYTEFVHELAGPATSLSPPSPQENPRSLLSSLESLKIAGLPCRTDCIEMLYGELQNLTSLNISLYPYLPPLFLDILSTPCMLAGRGDVWLPRLTTLYVSGTSGDALREVILKRRDAGVPLNSLYVEESCMLQEGDEEWLRENLQAFDFFEGSDDEDVVEFEDSQEEVDEWSDME